MSHYEGTRGKGRNPASSSNPLFNVLSWRKGSVWRKVTLGGLERKSLTRGHKIEKKIAKCLPMVDRTTLREKKKN